MKTYNYNGTEVTILKLIEVLNNLWVSESLKTFTDTFFVNGVQLVFSWDENIDAYTTGFWDIPRVKATFN